MSGAVLRGKPSNAKAERVEEEGGREAREGSQVELPSTPPCDLSFQSVLT